MLVGQLFGNSLDATKGRQMPNHWCDREARVVSVSSPVATQLPQAVGTAYAAGLRGEKVAVVAYFGDGGSSTGDFHVAMNFAGVFKTPNVFFCSNNQYAISMPFAKQTASGSIAVKAAAYGFPGVRVDGNDVLAVYRVTSEAVRRARAGDGPTLIEALTYRIGPHTTADDASRYRDEEEVERWRAFDPIDRYRTWLVTAGHADEAFVRSCEDEAAGWVAEVRAGIIAAEPPPAEWMFDWTFAEPPASLARQREEALGG
jgi:TPP-dependent pyruvate/acetoin dehydrogenase alpha subunit